MSQTEILKLGAALWQHEGDASPLPLEGTEVRGRVVGAIANVTVVQRFGNPFDHPVDIEYLFPLPEEAAVVDYVIRIGDRTIKADVKEREAAQQTYQDAVAIGKRASLLEQRRPNLFSIQIGNVQVGEKIVTELQYEDRLHYSDGAYEFVFPMGITPRYHSPSESASSARATDAPIALDESKVAPVTLELTVDAGANASNIVSRTHKIDLNTSEGQQFSLKLAEREIPNKDFVLRYEVASDSIAAAAWLSHDEDADTVVITLLPPKLDVSKTVAPREFIFVIDRSGSMSTDPMNQAKNALRACLRALGERDTFFIQAFDDRIEWFDTEARSLTQNNVDEAESWLDDIHARGGTEILGAIDAALAIKPDAQRTRYVVFLTDGAVSADEQAISKIASKRGDARVFTFGIGSAVNRYLLRKVAQIGRGASEFIGNDDDIETTMTRFQDRVSYPALLDIALTFDGAESWDTYPSPLPDLYIGQPLEIVTRLKRKGDSTLKFTGRADGQPITLSMAIPSAQTSDPTIQRIHARARIESLMDSISAGADAEKVRSQVISLGIEHRVATGYTSFVAVDSEIVDKSDGAKVNVAVALPKGVELKAMSQRMVGFMGPSNAGQFARSAASPPMAAMQAMAAPMPAPADSDEAEIDDMVRGIAASPTQRNMVDSLRKSVVGRGRRRGTPSEPPDDTESLSSIQPGEDALKHLARTQKINGSWDDNAERTAAALLTFVRAGHTTRQGNYRTQVNKAAKWLSDQVATLSGVALFAAIRALDELHTTTGDYGITDEARAKFAKPSSDIERAIMGESVSLPDKTASLDEIRLAALNGTLDSVQNVKLEGDDILTGAYWRMVGKPE